MGPERTLQEGGGERSPQKPDKECGQTDKRKSGARHCHKLMKQQDNFKERPVVECGQQQGRTQQDRTKCADKNHTDDLGARECRGSSQVGAQTVES